MTKKEKQKGRIEIREISVYGKLQNIDKSWLGQKSIIKVKRIRESKKNFSEETHYYISSLSSKTKAKTFGKIIRNHWGIESYHYIKDVIFREDYSKVKRKNSPCNMSILRNIVINIFRENKINKIIQATRLLRNNTKKMMDMILT